MARKKSSHNSRQEKKQHIIEKIVCPDLIRWYRKKSRRTKISIDRQEKILSCRTTLARETTSIIRVRMPNFHLLPCSPSDVWHANCVCEASNDGGDDDEEAKEEYFITITITIASLSLSISSSSYDAAYSVFHFPLSLSPSLSLSASTSAFILSNTCFPSPNLV